jgi:hypothetical protein
MGSHHVDNDISGELANVVSTDNGVKRSLLTLPCLVCSGLVFEQVSNLFFIFQSLFHMRDKSSEWKSLFLCALHHTFKQFESSGLIKVTVQKMGVGPGAQFESAILEESRDIYPPIRQSLEMLAACRRRPAAPLSVLAERPPHGARRETRRGGTGDTIYRGYRTNKPRLVC